VTGIGNEPDVRTVGYDPVRAFLIPSVDDSVDYARALGRVVMRCGHDLRTARDRVEGAKAAFEFRPDVVLLDIGLPGPDGYEVARHIRDHPCQVGLPDHPESLCLRLMRYSSMTPVLRLTSPSRWTSKSWSR
jgi:CheY-like chemotaxis protein